MRRRYFHYPHFKYDVWAACENNKLLAYVVTRTVSAKETGCAGLEAGRAGKIQRSRHASYVRLYEELKPLQDWQERKK